MAVTSSPHRRGCCWTPFDVCARNHECRCHPHHPNRRRVLEDERDARIRQQEDS